MTTPSQLAPAFTRRNPFAAPLINHWPLTQPGSGKETRHFIIGLNGSNITYIPGDSLGILPHNPPELVDELLRQLGFDPESSLAQSPVTLRQHLLLGCTLNRAGRKLLSQLHHFLPPGSQASHLNALMADPEAVSRYLFDRDYVDILREFNQARFPSPEEFVNLLAPITPRLYSIASCLDAHPGEVHLCVAIVRYESHGRKKKGLCTGFLADHTRLNAREIPVYIQESHGFRLPADRTRDIIMIGPGTGVAPFRAFLEQRALEGGTGRNWLFFGEQHRATDFFYAKEFAALLKNGTLHRLDLAFSRDQKEKIYVQDRMREQGRELWQWLHNGASLYVCGDAKHMAKDVHQTLIQIVRDQGGFSEEAASEYVNTTLMRTEKRYLRDVY